MADTSKLHAVAQPCAGAWLWYPSDILAQEFTATFIKNILFLKYELGIECTKEKRSCQSNSIFPAF